MSNPRFFIDHGMIHDRLTGKHVTTEPDSAFCDGIERCCELLNALAEQREPRTFPLLFTNEWLEEKIKTDPDIDCEVGTSPPVSPERKCEKCGSATGGEEAWVDNQIWCHPCADQASPVNSQERQT